NHPQIVQRRRDHLSGRAKFHLTRDFRNHAHRDSVGWVRGQIAPEYDKHNLPIWKYRVTGFGDRRGYEHALVGHSARHDIELVELPIVAGIDAVYGWKRQTRRLWCQYRRQPPAQSLRSCDRRERPGTRFRAQLAGLLGYGGNGLAGGSNEGELPIENDEQ